MDRFIHIRHKKKEHRLLVGRDEDARRLEACIERGEPICVYGETGVGKTHLVQSVLSSMKYIDLEIKNVELLKTFRNSDSHILIDNFDCSQKNVVEILKLCDGRLSRGTTIIVTTKCEVMEWCQLFHVKPLGLSDLIEIGRDEVDDVHSKAIECRGNIRNLLDVGATKDVISNPKEFIYKLLCTDTVKGEDMLGKHVEEHGYTWGVVHDNYTDADISLDQAATVADSMSTAENIESKMFQGDWDVSKIFALHGIIIPSCIINSSLNRDTLRPGSFWTKFNNFKMRESRLRDIRNRTRLGIDELHALKTICVHDPTKAVDTMKKYNIQSTDLDIINHLGFTEKIKPKTLTQLKKSLSCP